MFSRPCLHAIKALSSFRGKMSVVAVHKISKMFILEHCALRSVYTSSARQALVYHKGENNLAHGVLKNNRAKYMLAEEGTCSEDLSLDQFLDTLNIPATSTTDEIIDAFQIISDYAHKESIDISSSVFDKFVDTLTDNLKNMTPEQLCEVFDNFRKWPPSDSAKVRNFVEIWTALDDVIKEKCESWSTDQLLLFLDHVYRSFLIRHFSFVKYAIAKLTRKAKQLTPAQVVQVSFYAGANRWNHDMFDLEMRFFDCIDFLTMEEIGIVCMGFFKTQSPFRDPQLLHTIIKRIQTNKEPLDNVLITSILKMIKYSARDENNLELSNLYDWFINSLDTLSPMACTHLAISGTTSRLKHVPLLNALAEKFQNNAHIVRLKDLERMAGAYAMFNMNVANDIPLFDIIVDELRKPERLKEIHSHPFAYVNCLMFLTVKEKFPLDLISQVLSKEFMDKHYKHHIRNGKSMHIISNSVAIECKKWYKGPYLDEYYQSQLSKKTFRYMPERGGKYRLNSEQLAVFDIMTTIADHRGSWKYVKALHFLPHYDKGDLVLCNGVSNNPVRVENYFPKNEFGKIYNAPDTKKTWLVIVASPPQGYIWNTKEPTGSTLMKMRQLKAIGYTPVHIPLIEWQELKSTVDKIDYLKKLFSTVDFMF